MSIEKSNSEKFYDVRFIGNDILDECKTLLEKTFEKVSVNPQITPDFFPSTVRGVSLRDIVVVANAHSTAQRARDLLDEYFKKGLIPVDPATLLVFAAKNPALLDRYESLLAFDGSRVRPLEKGEAWDRSEPYREIVTIQKLRSCVIAPSFYYQEIPPADSSNEQKGFVMRKIDPQNPIALPHLVVPQTARTTTK